MRSLRTGSIGSMSAWLPSRRSTEHHSGAFSIWRFGHCAIGQRERQRPERRVLLEGHLFGSHGVAVPSWCLSGLCIEQQKTSWPQPGGRGEPVWGARRYVRRRMLVARIEPPLVPDGAGAVKVPLPLDRDPPDVPHGSAHGSARRHRVRVGQARAVAAATRPPYRLACSRQLAARCGARHRGRAGPPDAAGREGGTGDGTRPRDRRAPRRRDAAGRRPRHLHAW